MDTASEEYAPRPNWRQVGIWNGAGLGALLRIFRQNQFQIDRHYAIDSCIDLFFGCGNSLLTSLQRILCSSSLEKVHFREDPLFVLGHWRTGTTLTHELLALDPRHTYPTTYQCFAPGHFLISEPWLKPWTGFALPDKRPPDDMRMGWDLPQEDEFALCNLGVPSPYTMIAFPNRSPMDQEFLELDDVSPDQKQRWQRGWINFLKGVQRGKDCRIVLKSPTHTCRIPLLLELFPNARFVHLVRHPHAVFLSTVRLWKTLFSSQGYQRPDFEGLEDFVVRTFARMHDRFQSTRNLVAANRLCTIRFEDLVDDIPGTIEHVYQTLQLEQFDEVRPKLEQYVQQHRDHQRPTYDLAEEWKNRLADEWSGYFEAYGYDGHRAS